MIDPTLTIEAALLGPLTDEIREMLWLIGLRDTPESRGFAIGEQFSPSYQDICNERKLSAPKRKRYDETTLRFQHWDKATLSWLNE